MYHLLVLPIFNFVVCSIWLKCYELNNLAFLIWYKLPNHAYIPKTYKLLSMSITLKYARYVSNMSKNCVNFSHWLKRDNYTRCCGRIITSKFQKYYVALEDICLVWHMIDMKQKQNDFVTILLHIICILSFTGVHRIKLPLLTTEYLLWLI